jgi:hypothetical protein
MMPARLISEHYPSFKDAGTFLDAPESWLGRISPFGRCPTSELALVIDDLRAGSQVLLQEGSLVHNAACVRAHAGVPFVAALKGIERETFAVRLIVPCPPVHPKVMAVFPEISSRSFAEHPHLFRSAPRDIPELRTLNPELQRHIKARSLSELPKAMPDMLCTYRPGDGEWSWETGDLVDCLDYAALFLAKHAVWVRTGADARASWIGSQASHNPIDMLNELDPDGECRCGRGRPYRICCRPLDEMFARVAAELRSIRPMRPAA